MMNKKREWGILALAAAMIVGAWGTAMAHHGGGHCKYVWDDKYGTPYEITFKGGQKISGILFVMGNKADELLVGIDDSGKFANVFLSTITTMERRKTAGERDIFDFTTDKGVKFPAYDLCGNILFFKTDFGILDIAFSDIESMIAPPAPKKAAK